MLTEEHRAALQRDVDALNATLKRVLEECGASIELRTSASYDVTVPSARVAVEITTGRVVIATPWR